MNEEPNIVQNCVEPIIDEVASKATQEIFCEVIDLNFWKDIADDISASMAVALIEASFMETDLELTEKQKETLSSGMSRLVSTAVRKYKEGLKKDERTKAIVDRVEKSTRAVIERTLSQIGAEINRGAVINSTAVSADAKNEDYNKMELRYSKSAGDITVPTKGVFISTNCIEVIKNSIKALPQPQAAADEKNSK